MRFIFLIILLHSNKLACTYLPPSLSSINSQTGGHLQQPNSEIATSESSTAESVRNEAIGIAEEIAEKIYGVQSVTATFPTETRNASKFVMDPDTVKTLETLLEHALRHVAVLIHHPELKSAYQKFIDIFPPGTIGGTLTIIGKELLAMLWTCIIKRNATPVVVQLQ